MKMLITARVLLVASLAGLVGCGGGSSAPITPPPPTLSISPGSATLSPSASVQFTAHLGNSTPSVNWSLSGAACSGAVCGTVDASGLYKAPASVTGNLSVRVTAALQSDLMKTSSANVTVTGSSSGKATLTPTSATLVSGGLQLFAANNCPLSNIDVFCGFRLSGQGCSGASCGTLIGGGFSRTYQAPLAIPNPPKVTITLYDLLGATLATATVNLLPATDALLSGSYVLLISGDDATGPLTTVGVFAADGSGHITGGSLDLLQSVGMTNLPIVGGSYSIGTDLRGLLTLQTPQGTRSYKIALNPSGSARVIESNGTGTQASGVLKTQSASSLSNATLSGNFAFGLSGNAADSTRAGLVGAFQSDGQGGLISGLLDANINGATSAAVSWQGGYTVNAIGRLTMNLTAPLAGTSGPLNFVGYIVSGKEIALIGSDSASTAHLLTGWAHVQSNTSFPSNLAMVAALNGVSGGGTSALAANLFGPSPAQAYVTQNVAGSSQIAVPANWSHNLGSQGRGTLALQSSPSHSFVFYLFNSESGFILEDSGSEVLSGELLAGWTASFAGNYRVGTQGASLVQSSFSGAIEGADCAQITGSLDIRSAGSNSTNSFAANCATDPNNQVTIFSISQPTNMTWALHQASLTQAVAVSVSPGDSYPILISVEK